MDIDITGGIFNDPDYQQSVGQVQQLQDETQRAILQLQATPVTNLTLSNTGKNVTLAFSGAALTADFTGTATISQISDAGALASLDAGGAVANLSTTASGTYTQAELQAVIDKLNALLGSLRTAGIIAT